MQWSLRKHQLTFIVGGVGGGRSTVIRLGVGGGERGEEYRNQMGEDGLVSCNNT